MAIVCIGVALAKNVFAIHGVDDVGKAVPDWRDPSAKSLLLRRARRMLGPPASEGAAMAMNRAQFQRGMSWRDVQSRYSSEAACEAELTHVLAGGICLSTLRWWYGEPVSPPG
jgi:hypothetical protein